MTRMINADLALEALQKKQAEIQANLDSNKYDKYSDRKIVVARMEDRVVTIEDVMALIDKLAETSESVNHPTHYVKNGRDCIECMIDDLGPQTVYGFCLGNMYKYRFRAGQKPGQSSETDLKKAEWYRDYAMKLAEEYGYDYD